MSDRKKEKALVDEVMHRLQRPKRTKRTLVLSEDIYDEFEKLCRKENRFPSEVIDQFISIFVEQKKGK